MNSRTDRWITAAAVAAESEFTDREPADRWT